MLRFKLKPFPCPECGHFLLVDGIRQDASDPQQWDVKTVLDDTTATDPDHFFQQLPADVRSMGRWRLYREVLKLRGENRTMQRHLDEAHRGVLGWITKNFKETI